MYGIDDWEGDAGPVKSTRMVDMAGEIEKEQWTRRGFLGVSTAAIAAASVLGPDKAGGQEQSSAQILKGDRSASDPGPTNRS